MSRKRRAIVWFRQDLRLSDNEALTEAMEAADEILPLFVFDERTFTGKTPNGFPKTGVHRTQFIIECIQDLRASLKKLSGDIMVRIGKPEEIIPQIAFEIKSSWVFCNRERTKEEVEVQDNIEKGLWSIGQEIRYSRGKMLYYTRDLPFPITQTPETFSAFRKEVEKFVQVRPPFPRPTGPIPMISAKLDYGEIPTVQTFGMEVPTADERTAFPLKGGETAGLERLKDYTYNRKLISSYKETRNQLLGEAYSSKFSAHLAQGALSPKIIYQEIKKYEADHGANKSTYWLIFELLWRDYFRLIAKKHGSKIFLKTGIKGSSTKQNKADLDILNLWIQGRTGVPFVDANMLELKHTGFMSNRGRQNVASFLINDLGILWKLGAEYFESQLIDYDPCSNYGNWMYLAGVGNDPRENRHFNIVSQAERYDPDATYIKKWLPQLECLKPSEIFRIDRFENDVSNVKLGLHYPKALVKFSR